MLSVTKYVQNPLYVDAVLVTPENMADVAKWVNGKVSTTKNNVAFVEVDVLRPRTPRHGQAFAGDYVLRSTQGLKVYNAEAFAKAFVTAPPVAA